MFHPLSTRFIRFAFALLASLALAGQAVAAGEVKLLKVESIASFYKGFWHRGSFEAVVANLAYVKKVSIHYKKQDGSWGDFPLSYNRPADTGKEIWSAGFSRSGGGSNFDSPADPMEFVVKYEVGGTTYWDNNGGANYRFAQDGGSLLKDVNVYFDDYQPTTKLYNNTFYGAVTLRNIAYAKVVEMHYSTDNWVTPLVAKGRYNPNHWIDQYSSAPNPNAYGFEEWTFAVNVGTATRIDYAIKYTVNGQTYWDNNFGRNYTTTLTR